jgi:uncharacterized protein YndB with AHSA1/START domain
VSSPPAGSKVLVSIRVRATPQRAFDAFVGEIGTWWRGNPLFRFTPREPGVLSFEPGPEGRLIERRGGGKVFEIGRIRAWEPPHRLVFGWRQAAFAPGQDTEVVVRFEPVGDETRVTVEHFGWDSVPHDHVARHGFPNPLFLTRHGEWWRSLLASYKDVLGADGR